MRPFRFANLRLHVRTPRWAILCRFRLSCQILFHGLGGCPGMGGWYGCGTPGRSICGTCGRATPGGIGRACPWPIRTCRTPGRSLLAIISPAQGTPRPRRGPRATVRRARSPARHIDKTNFGICPRNSETLLFICGHLRAICPCTLGRIVPTTVEHHDQETRNDRQNTRQSAKR